MTVLYLLPAAISVLVFGAHLLRLNVPLFAAVGDVATLMGTDGEESITVDTVAMQAGTIAYEILRQIRRERQTLSGYSVRVQAHPAVVDFLKFESRDALQEAERRYMRRIELVARQEYHIEQYDLQGK